MPTVLAFLTFFLSTFFLSAFPLLAQPVEEPSIFDARGLFKLEQFHDAEEVFQALVKLDPDNGEAWFGLAQTLLHLERPAQATEAFARSLELETFPRRSMVGAARAAAAAGDGEQAVHWLERHRDSGPLDPALRYEDFAKIADSPGFRELAMTLWPCDMPERRQFDFWVGKWNVTSAAGAGAVNEITRIQDGCALQESYTSGPFTGTSLSFWDAASGHWHQTWVDHRGGSLFLTGGLEDTSMVMHSDLSALPLNRITWTPRGSAQVRQLWERTKDHETWEVVFDGIYTKQPDD